MIFMGFEFIYKQSATTPPNDLMCKGALKYEENQPPPHQVKLQLQITAVRFARKFFKFDQPPPHLILLVVG